MKIQIRVIPKAKQNKIEKTAEGYRIRVTASPENGKANAAAIKLLAAYLGATPSRLRVVKGMSSRDKLIEFI